MTTREQIIAAAFDAGLMVIWDGKLGREDYHSIMGSFPALERFYRIVANQTKDQCAAICYEQNWELRGEEMSEMILATKEKT